MSHMLSSDYVIVKAKVFEGVGRIMSGRLDINGTRKGIWLSRSVPASGVGVDIEADLSGSRTVSRHDE
jgi:hypothetical protein